MASGKSHVKDENPGGMVFKQDLTSTSTIVFRLQETRDSCMLSNTGRKELSETFERKV